MFSTILCRQYFCMYNTMMFTLKILHNFEQCWSQFDNSKVLNYSFNYLVKLITLKTFHTRTTFTMWYILCLNIHWGLLPRREKPLSLWVVASGTYSFSMRMEEDAPPPLQMDATPFSPDLSACNKWITIRAPDILPQTSISR